MPNTQRPRAGLSLCALLAGIAGHGPTVAAAANAATAPTARSESPSERLVHRYLDVAVSSDGKRMASVEGDSPPGTGYPVVRELVIRSTAAKPTANDAPITVALPCGHERECWPGSPVWTPDSKQLNFTLRTPGTHTYDLYAVDAQGGKLQKLLAFDGTIKGLKFAQSGELAMLATAHAAKESGATEAGAPVSGDLDAPPAEQRIAILTGATLRYASPADLYVYEYDWRPDGQGFVGTAAAGNGDDHWWTAELYAFADGAGRAIYKPADARQQLADPEVSPDGHRVAFIAGIMSDFGSTGGDIYTLPLDGVPDPATPAAAPAAGATGTSVALDITPDMHASATAIAWSCKGTLRAKLLAGDQTQLVDFGAAPTTTVRPRILWSGAETLGGRDAGITAGCPSPVTAAIHDSFTQPPEIEAGPLGRWRDVTVVNRGLQMPMRVQSLSWSNGGFDVQGWLMLPEQTNGKIPMITIVHGGPAAATVPRFSGPGLLSSLLARGYAVFMPNPRGSYGQGERFTRANVRDLGHGDLGDILAGINAAEKAAPIDETRLGITGGSYGGFMTMWAVTQTHRFGAAVAAASVSDWLSYYGENGIDAWMIPYFGASVYDDPEVYARSSPINYIKNVRTPTFEWAGEHDIECPPSQTQEFWHALKAMGVPTSIMIYPGEGHGLRDPAHAADAVSRTVAWFDHYLGDARGP
jgi:dienelactone hydrolase